MKKIYFCVVALNQYKSQTSVPTVPATENWWIKMTPKLSISKGPDISPKAIYWQTVDRLTVAWLISLLCSCLCRHRFLIRNKTGRYKHETAVFTVGLSNCIIVFFSNIDSYSLENAYLFNPTEKAWLSHRLFFRFYVYISTIFPQIFP